MDWHARMCSTNAYESFRWFKRSSSVPNLDDEAGLHRESDSLDGPPKMIASDAVADMAVEPANEDAASVAREMGLEGSTEETSAAITLQANFRRFLLRKKPEVSKKAAMKRSAAAAAARPAEAGKRLVTFEDFKTVNSATRRQISQDDSFMLPNLSERADRVLLPADPLNGDSYDLASRATVPTESPTRHSGSTPALSVTLLADELALVEAISDSLADDLRATRRTTHRSYNTHRRRRGSLSHADISISLLSADNAQWSNADLLDGTQQVTGNYSDECDEFPGMPGDDGDSDDGSGGSDDNSNDKVNSEPNTPNGDQSIGRR